MESVVVMYPSPGIGHLISMVELGKLIITHNPSFSVIILTTTPSFNAGSTAPYIRRVSATTPAITFHHLPPISIDPRTYPSFQAAIYDILRLNIPNVRQALQSISLSAAPVTAFIVDMFCTPAATVAAEFGIATHGFFTSGAASLAWCLYLPTVDRNTTQSFKDINDYIEFPGLPPLHSSDMPVLMLDRNNTEYKSMIEYFSLIPKLSGLIANTFQALEHKYVQAISDGLCFLDGPTPPVFCIGPLIATGDKSGSGGDCLVWLDSQPSRSVVFLCFGSLGLFTAEQLKEIATGLEKSGQRFLWVVRNPPPADKSKMSSPTAEPDLDTLLPEGFLGRTKDKGLVVKSWAPQVEVLNHDSVGGFVSHCGWNSVLEAVSAGVPMVAWPLYAEQKMNRAYLVEDYKLALPLSESEGGFVTAAELEKRVRQLMGSEDEEAIRRNIAAASGGAKAAMKSGGSSLTALAKLVELWSQK